MANVIPPPLPPPPPPPQLLNFQQPPQQQQPQQNQVAQASVSKKPYITIKNLTTVVDQSIHRYVDEVKESLDLKELPVIGPSGTSKSTAAPKFERTQGDVPELKVDIYEQMVYHRAKSTNSNRLEIFVPTRYKINYDKIKQYFATKGGDKEVQDLIHSVIKAYGNNNNSLFYKHTIAGKTVGAGAGAAASRSRPGTSSGSDLDKQATERIQNQIDNWHNKYAEWSFYDNASSFFIQNIKLEPDDLLTLKMDFDDVIAGAGAGAGGLVTIVDEISGKYTALKDKYTANIGVTDIVTASSTLDNYNSLFEKLYAEIDKRKTDPLDYVTERQRDFPSYTFDVNARNYLLRAFERLHTISQEMTTAYNTNTFGDTPINSKIKLLETLNDEYTQLIKGIERDEKLTTANDVFTKYMLGTGIKGGFSNFIPNYKIIQYVFWLIRGGTDVANANFVNNAFEVNYADVNPEDLYGLIRDLQGLVDEDERKQAQFMKDEGAIKTYEFIIELLKYRIEIDPLAIGQPYPPRGSKIQNIVWNLANDNVTIKNKGEFTTLINNELRPLGHEAINLNKNITDNCSQRIIEIESKIRELKGKHFASMLIFYNYLEAKKANGMAEMAEIAEFFNTFYEDSKLMNPEIDSHSSIVGDTPKTVPTFSFGIDILFWTLLRITKYYSDKHINFIKKMKEQIGPENPDLRNLRIEIGVKENKLKHICNLIAKTGEIPIDTIIPDRAGYYIKPGAAGAGLYTGFVNPDQYKVKWHKKIDPTKNRDGTAAKVISTANKMNKKLNASLGMTGATATDAPKMAEMLSRLIELNTIQVVNMLFAKPRNIWYSPDLQMKGETDDSSNWIVFQLDRNKIISGRAFKIFKQKLMTELVVTVGGGTAQMTRIQCILNKAWTTEVQPIVYKEKNADPPAFLIFIIATEPRPRMLDKDNVKDATDAMLDNPSFSEVVVSGPAGSTDIVSDNVIENGSNLSGAITTALDKIKGKIIPTKESCATGSDAILNASNDLNDSFKKTFKSIGIDLEQKVDKLLQKAPPPPPPAMIPPPLPPPPPSAAALAAHQAGVQAAQAAALAAAQAAEEAAAAQAALLAVPAPVPPLPPPPPPPPPTNAEIVAAAWSEVDRASQGLIVWGTGKQSRAEPNREYAKKLCEYAKVSVDHIYKVNAEIVKRDMDEINYPDQWKHQIQPISDKITDIVNMGTDTYCDVFHQSPSTPYRDMLKNILTNIQKTVDVDDICVDVIVKSVEIKQQITRDYYSKLGNTPDAITMLHAEPYTTLKNEITRLNAEIKSLTTSSLGLLPHLKTDSDNLKQLSLKLHKINDNIVRMMKAYENTAGIYKKLEPMIIKIVTEAAATAAAEAAATAAADAAAAAAADAKNVSDQATTAAANHNGVPAVLDAVAVVTAASADAAAASAAATTASQNAAGAKNLADAQRYQQEAERQKTLAESKRDDANDAMVAVTIAVTAASAAAVASAAAASAAAAAQQAAQQAALQAALQEARNYKRLLTEAVNAFQDILIPPASLPDIPDFDINPATNTAKFKEVAHTVVNLLFETFQPKIQEYNTDTARSKVNIVGVGKDIDEDKLDILEKAAAVCLPNIDVSDVRGLFNKIVQLLDGTPDMNGVLNPLKDEARALITSITPATTDPANSTTFSNLKDKCVEIARTYRENKENSDRIKLEVNALVDQYHGLFDDKQQEVLENIRTQITGLAVSDLPDGIDEGQGLLGQIGGLLTSVN